MTGTIIGPKALDMLERIERGQGKLLLISITSAGGQSNMILDRLRGAGLAKYAEHPTVKRGGIPADAVAITPEGIATLDQRRPKRAQSSRYQGKP